ncbi:MAG: DUF58 domain-containing protein [Sulfurimonas sp.]|nr:MAG: DUF58 domain-containing protein [Sulfurimonas sp.]
MFKKFLSSNKALALILLKAQKEVYSSIVGNNNTRVKADAYDFAELRPYETGDDIKHIDWIISSKLAQPHVKIFHKQSELNLSIVTILNSSVKFGSIRLKQDLIAEISALIAFSSIKQGDPYEAYIANENLYLSAKKNKQVFSIKNFVQTIIEYDSLTKHVEYKNIISNLYAKLKQKSMIFLISDFFNTKNFDIKALSLKHELIVIMVRDHFEERPEILENLSVTDPISGKNAKVILTSKSLKDYRNKLIQEEKEFMQVLKKSSVKFIKIYTEEDPSQKILKLMSYR